VIPAGAGTINKYPDKPYYAPGEVVALTASANPGYTFSYFSGDASRISPVTVTMDGNKTVTAYFVPNNINNNENTNGNTSYTLTTNVIPAGAGTINKYPDKPSYASGEEVTLTASANPGYTFDSWSGDVSGTNQTITVTMDSNKTVTAHFVSNINNNSNRNINWNTNVNRNINWNMNTAVATPTFTPPAGTYTSPQNVTISTTTPGATIRYTTDGSIPSPTVGTLYTVPVTISTTTTLKAIAYTFYRISPYQNGVITSPVASALYTINIVPTCPHLIGDVNCTGIVDNSDLAKLANFIHGDPSISAQDVGITQNGDINCTGTIDAADLAKLANAAYGIDPDGHHLPIPPNPAFVCEKQANTNINSVTILSQSNISYLEQSLRKLAELFIDQAEAKTTMTSQCVRNTSVGINKISFDTKFLTYLKK
jgi:uncharacterized repeat protein (TIGR02543 family)